jgi:Lon protease-like protein
MTRDALGGERLIGWSARRAGAGQLDGGGHGIDDQMEPPVYPVGCASRITQFSGTDDGRYLLTDQRLRFRIREELPLLSGYRRVVPDWRPFAHDRDTLGDPEFDRERLIRGLKGFFAGRQISADWEAIGKAPGEHLVISLAMACPFAPSENQALLEAADPDERARLLTTLVGWPR